ncbi:MAG: phosphatase PAP2 family protein [Actinobacteria bacterium]|nr:phosphatase PAP2 family protein [Actinomycetota bacterium]
MTSSIPATTDSRVISRPATIAVAVLALALVCTVGAWIALRGGEPFAIDSVWLSMIGVDPGSAGYAAAATLAAVGSAVGVSLCVGIASAWLFVAGSRVNAVVLATTAVVGVACSELLKLLIARPRPFDALLEPSGFSYPSGHSMGAAALATGLALVALAHVGARRSRAWVIIAAVSWVTLMMWSRTALHVHWLSDTIAGALLGWSVAVLVRAVLMRAAVTRAAAGP